MTRPLSRDSEIAACPTPLRTMWTDASIPRSLVCDQVRKLVEKSSLHLAL
jgi:hypothetical protein